MWAKIKKKSSSEEPVNIESVKLKLHGTFVIRDMSSRAYVLHAMQIQCSGPDIFFAGSDSFFKIK